MAVGTPIKSKKFLSAEKLEPLLEATDSWILTLPEGPGFTSAQIATAENRLKEINDSDAYNKYLLTFSTTLFRCYGAGFQKEFLGRLPQSDSETLENLIRAFVLTMLEVDSSGRTLEQQFATFSQVRYYASENGAVGEAVLFLWTATEGSNQFARAFGSGVKFVANRESSDLSKHGKKGRADKGAKTREAIRAAAQKHRAHTRSAAIERVAKDEKLSLSTVKSAFTTLFPGKTWSEGRN